MGSSNSYNESLDQLYVFNYVSNPLISEESSGANFPNWKILIIGSTKLDRTPLCFGNK